MTQKTSKARQGGFTLIEILIVIGIIAILAAIVLVAVNPAKHFREAANAQRSANVNAILNAIGQSIVDNNGSLPAGLAGAGDFGPDHLGGSNTTDPMTNFDDLCNALVPEYIGGIPGDPGLNDQIITDGECGSNNVETDYTIEVNSGRVTICAPETVNVTTGNQAAAADRICVTR